MLPDEVLVEIAAWLKRYQLDAWLLVSHRFRRMADLKTIDSPRRSLREVKLSKKRISLLPDFGPVKRVKLRNALQFLDYSCVEEFVVFQDADLTSITASEFSRMLCVPAVVGSFGK